jgi:hypothetical protein
MAYIGAKTLNDQLTNQNKALGSQLDKGAYEQYQNNFDTSANDARGLLGGSDQIESYKGIPNDSTSRALQDYSSKVYANDLNKIKAQRDVEKFAKQGEIYTKSFQRAHDQEAFRMGAEQAAAQYENERQAIRQSTINSILGGVGTMAGAALGAASTKKPGVSNSSSPMNTSGAAIPAQEPTNYLSQSTNAMTRGPFGGSK